MAWFIKKKKSERQPRIGPDAEGTGEGESHEKGIGEACSRLFSSSGKHESGKKKRRTGAEILLWAPLAERGGGVR